MALVVAISAGCKAPSLADRASFNHQVENLDQFDAETYQRVWNGDPSLPDRDMPQVPPTEWSRLLREKTEVGLRGMDAPDRRVLLQGGLKAYLMDVKSTRRRITGDRADESSLVSEVYGSREGLNTILRAREEESSGAVSTWGDVLVASSRDRHLRAFVSEDYSEAEVWTQEANGVWSCDVERDGEVTFAISETEYVGNLIRIVLDGRPTRQRAIGNRDTVQFELTVDGIAGVVWVDQETLFPIAYLLPRYSSAGSEIPTRTVEILGLNVAPVERPSEHCS